MRFHTNLFAALAVLGWASVSVHADPAPMPVAVVPASVAANSYANVNQFRTQHLSLDLAVDFASQRLSGTVELSFQRLDPTAKQLVLDSSQLDVTQVEAAPMPGHWVPATFTIGKEDEILGAPLTIDLPADAVRVRIHYSTQPSASGLQWLSPAQTTGKKLPFLFTQSEAIHARSWIPSQDTPYVRATYEAHIRAPRGLRAVMSAEMHDAADKSGIWNFRMPQPIPSYLIALAVGDIGFRATGPRTGVYAEPGVLDKAAYEFALTEKTIEITEKLYGPYRWGRYDLLVLPPSFPFGGMENPRLTFATPTVITGDRALVSLVSHELAHSWSGNLVTNASWNDFWLNEGFTEYLTYRLTEAQFGNTRADMERVLGLQDLRDAMADAEPADRALVRSTAAKDPDAVFSSIPYERGALFLSWLEHRFGRDKFDAFLRGWFDDHAFQSATTPEFLAYLQDKLLAQQPDKVTSAEIDAWVYQEPLPTFADLPQSDTFTRLDALRSAWIEGRTALSALPTSQWSIQEWQHFLDGMPDSVSLPQLQALDAANGLSQTPNAILASSWFRVAIDHGDTEVYPAVEQYLNRVGRVWLIGSLYRSLAKTPTGLIFARKVYAEASPGYHPITRKAVERVLADKTGAA